MVIVISEALHPQKYLGLMKFFVNFLGYQQNSHNFPRPVTSKIPLNIPGSPE